MKAEINLQTKLYELNDNLMELINLYEKRKLSNKILITGNKGIGKSTLVYHFINYIFSKEEDHSYDLKNNSIRPENRSFKLFQNNSHPNIYNIRILDDKKNIEINQIREMINYANKSSFNDKPRFVIINNVEELNTNSLNALLKIVEEPNENLFFILIHNNNKSIQNTLKSRCIMFKIKLSFEQSISISSKILNINIYDILNEELINYYSTPGEFINLINFSNKYKIDLKKKTLKELLLIIINENYYNKDKFIKNYISNLIQYYFLKMPYSNKSKEIDLLYNKFIQMYFNCNKYNLNYENWTNNKRKIRDNPTFRRRWNVLCL